MTGTIGKPHCSPLLSLPCFLFLPLSLFLHLFLLCVFFFDHIEKKKKKSVRHWETLSLPVFVKRFEDAGRARQGEGGKS